MENGILDSSQRMETIIFENTTFKSKPCGESKNKYNSNIKQRNEKGINIVMFESKKKKKIFFYSRFM